MTLATANIDLVEFDGTVSTESILAQSFCGDECDTMFRMLLWTWLAEALEILWLRIGLFLNVISGVAIILFPVVMFVDAAWFAVFGSVIFWIFLVWLTFMFGKLNPTIFQHIVRQFQFIFVFLQIVAAIVIGCLVFVEPIERLSIVSFLIAALLVLCIDAAPMQERKKLMPIFFVGSVVSFGVASLVYLNVTGHGRTLLYFSFFPTHAFNLSVMLSDRITTIGLFVIRFFANQWLRPSAMSVIEVRLQKHVTSGYHRDQRDLSKSHLQKHVGVSLDDFPLYGSRFHVTMDPEELQLQSFSGHEDENVVAFYLGIDHSHRFSEVWNAVKLPFYFAGVANTLTLFAMLTVTDTPNWLIVAANVTTPLGVMLVIALMMRFNFTIFRRLLSQFYYVFTFVQMIIALVTGLQLYDEWYQVYALAMQTFSNFMLISLDASPLATRRRMMPAVLLYGIGTIVVAVPWYFGFGLARQHRLVTFQPFGLQLTFDLSAIYAERMILCGVFMLKFVWNQWRHPNHFAILSIFFDKMMNPDAAEPTISPRVMALDTTDRRASSAAACAETALSPLSSPISMIHPVVQQTTEASPVVTVQTNTLSELGSAGVEDVLRPTPITLRAGGSRSSLVLLAPRLQTDHGYGTVLAPDNYE